MKFWCPEQRLEIYIPRVSCKTVNGQSEPWTCDIAKQSATGCSSPKGLACLEVEWLPAMGGYRSASSRRLSTARRCKWLKWKSQQHMVVPEDRLWLMYRLAMMAMSHTGKFGSFLASTCLARVSVPGRQRDIYPLSQISEQEFKPKDWTTQRWALLRAFANAVIGSLNWCYGVKKGTVGPRCRTIVQQDVVRRIVGRCLDFEKRLQEPSLGKWESLVPDWVDLGERPLGLKFGNLQAEAVDVLSQAGACDPIVCLSDEVRAVLENENLMFAEAPSGLDVYEGVPLEEKEQYVKLVARQLRAGQLALSSHAKGGGGVFAVGKPGGKRQRAVWNGNRVSASAAKPPKPRHLASPTALTFLECKEGQTIRCSKRDASCWFDQLALPKELQLWMGRPPVSRDELCFVGGMSGEEIQEHLLTGSCIEADPLVPVSLTWPMGFAWSSYVAQEFLLDICKSAGLTEQKVLSCDASTPTTFELVFAAATDDLMIFSDAGQGHTMAAAEKVDAEFQRRGAVRNAAKDVTDECFATCVGVQLEEGTHWGVPPQRCIAMMVSLLFVLSRGKASPKQVQQILGVQQWFDLLSRCKLSVYNKVYSFVRDPMDSALVRVPPEVLFELCVSMLLGVFWRVDLRRPFLPLISATDASTTFGFGASVARVSPAFARRVARVAEKQGDFVVLDGGYLLGQSAKRLGQAHNIDISMTEFVHVLSVRSKHAAHVNVLEGEAFLMWLRWLLRSRQRHCARTVVLVDSSVWCCAVAKGRSSTQLNRLLRKAAALELAGDLQVHLVLVPSAENPSDVPSRGARCVAEVGNQNVQPPPPSRKWQRMLVGFGPCCLAVLASGMMCMGPLSADRICVTCLNSFVCIGWPATHVQLCFPGFLLMVQRGYLGACYSRCTPSSAMDRVIVWDCWA